MGEKKGGGFGSTEQGSWPKTAKGMMTLPEMHGISYLPQEDLRPRKQNEDLQKGET